MHELLDALIGRPTKLRLTLVNGRELCGEIHTPVGHTYPNIFTFVADTSQGIEYVAVDHVVTAQIL